MTTNSISVLWLFTGVGLCYNLITKNMDNSMIFGGLHIGSSITVKMIQAYREAIEERKNNQNDIRTL